MKWAEHVAHVEKKRNAYKVFIRKTEGNIPLENLDVDRRISKLILEKYDGVVWIK
jgi:hypothetical protein